MATSRVRRKQIHPTDTVEKPALESSEFCEQNFSAINALCKTTLSIYVGLNHVKLELILKIFLCILLNFVPNSAHAKSFEQGHREARSQNLH